MPNRKHDWNNLQNYLHVHEKVLRKYAACFSTPPAYRIERPTELWLELSVTLHFHQIGIKLEIDKTAEIQTFGRGRETARTLIYSYSVSDFTGSFFRYCSPHPDHRPYHHKHVYEPVTREEIRPPLRLSENEVPHVDEVIDEVLTLR